MKMKRWLILIFVLIAGTARVFPQFDSIAALDSVEYAGEDDEDDFTPMDTLSLFQRKQECLEQLKNVAKDTSLQATTHFTPDFRNKYKNDPDFDYSKTKGGKTFWQKLQDWIYRMLKLLFGWDKEHKISNATDIAFKVISGMVILIVLYVIVRVMMKHQGKWFFQRKNESIDLDINDLEELIQYANFEKMIAESESKGDTRQSIRLYYLWLLRTLNEKKIINWNPQKTNADYMYEIKSDEIKEKFTYLSYLYNYIWYGEFSITDADYVNAKKAFLSYLKSNGNNG